MLPITIADNRPQKYNPLYKVRVYRKGVLLCEKVLFLKWFHIGISEGGKLCFGIRVDRNWILQSSSCVGERAQADHRAHCHHSLQCRSAELFEMVLVGSLFYCFVNSCIVIQLWDTVTFLVVLFVESISIKRAFIVHSSFLCFLSEIHSII